MLECKVAFILTPSHGKPMQLSMGPAGSKECDLNQLAGTSFRAGRSQQLEAEGKCICIVSFGMGRRGWADPNKLSQIKRISSGEVPVGPPSRTYRGEREIMT